MTRYLVGVLVLVVLLAVVTACALAAGGGNPNPGAVFPPSAGTVYSYYGDLYWQWIISIPAATNPTDDPTGDWAYLGQPGGPVFLLANTWVLPGETNTAERWVTVGRGQAFLLSLASFSIGPAEVCMEDGACAWGLSGDNLVSWMRECGDTCIGQFAESDLYASVDGEPLQSLLQYRVQSSQPFACSYPEGSLLSDLVGDEAGLIPVNVSDGYYLLLAPLAKGEHTVSYGASWPQFGEGTVAGVIYHITVE